MSKYYDYVKKHLDVRSEDGHECYALCPFHEDRTASFAVNCETGLFICYSCGEKGNWFKLVKRIGEEYYPSPRTVDDLSTSVKRLLMPESEDLKVRPDAWLAQFGRTDQSDAYWRSRGMSLSMIEDWDLGQDRRLRCYTIGLRDSAGRVLGVIRRRNDEVGWKWSSKYMNPKGFQRKINLFGSWMVESRNGQLAICEGPADVLAMWNVGQQAVGLFGSSMSDHQRQMIIRLAPIGLIVATDNDKAGNAAYDQIAEELGGIYPLGRLELEDGADPGSLTPRELKRALAIASRRTRWSAPD